MNANSALGLPERRNAFLAIAIGGLSAGILDLAQALFLFGTKVPLGIAAGLLGRQAAHGGGITIYVLGVLLHFFIALSAATVYYLASRTLKFLTEHWFICGLIYGAIVDQVMTLIVLHSPRFTRKVRINFTTCFWVSASTCSRSGCPFHSVFGGSRNRKADS